VRELEQNYYRNHNEKYHGRERAKECEVCRDNNAEPYSGDAITSKCGEIDLPSSALIPNEKEGHHQDRQ
jgi:hypothetical protein